MAFTKAQLESITKNLRDIANILETAAKAISPPPNEQPKRGRKPGAVADDIRCTAEISKGDRCKNRSINDGLCGKHRQN